MVDLYSPYGDYYPIKSTFLDIVLWSIIPYVSYGSFPTSPTACITDLSSSSTQSERAHFAPHYIRNPSRCGRDGAARLGNALTRNRNLRCTICRCEAAPVAPTHTPLYYLYGIQA